MTDPIVSAVKTDAQGFWAKYRRPVITLVIGLIVGFIVGKI